MDSDVISILIFEITNLDNEFFFFQLLLEKINNGIKKTTDVARIRTQEEIQKLTINISEVESLALEVSLNFSR